MCDHYVCRRQTCSYVFCPPTCSPSCRDLLSVLRPARPITTTAMHGTISISGKSWLPTVRDPYAKVGMHPCILPLLVHLGTELFHLLFGPAHESREQRHHDGGHAFPKVDGRPPPDLLPLGLSRPLIDGPLVWYPYDIGKAGLVHHIPGASASGEVESGLLSSLDHQVAPSLDSTVRAHGVVVAIQWEVNVLDFDPATPVQVPGHRR